MPADQPAPRHLPYRNAQAIFQIGLSPMQQHRWIDVGADHAGFMAEKRQRLAGRPPLYYGSLPVSLPAQAELRQRLSAHLIEDHGTIFRREGHGLRDAVDGSLHALDGAEPLVDVGNLVEEDFILFQNIDGRDIITAASNAYTSSGRIVSTVGRDMSFAHEPVPGLNAQLGARIDRVLGNLQTGAPVVRFNWFLTSIASRLFPEGSHEANVAAAERTAALLTADHSRAGDMLWVRVERQTFLRLPDTQALAFGLHTYSDPLSSLQDDAESLAALHRLLAEYSEDRLRYAAMLAIRAPVMRWIDDRLR